MQRLSLVLTLAVATCACGADPTAPSVVEPTRPTSSLSGLVFTTTDSGLVAVTGARVRATVGSFVAETLTDNAGAYRLSNLYAGDLTVATSKAGYEPDQRALPVKGETHLDIRIVPRLPYTLTGTVVESTPSGPKPMSGLEMYCDACGVVGHTFTSTDSSGAYTFTHVFNGRTAIYLSQGAYLNVQREVIVSGNTRFDIVLAPR